MIVYLYHLHIPNLFTSKQSTLDVAFEKRCVVNYLGDFPAKAWGFVCSSLYVCIFKRILSIKLKCFNFNRR